MRKPEKGPRGGLVVWLMAVIVISLAPAMHPIAADIAVLSLTGIRDQRTQPPITAPRPVRASTPGRAFS